ncbi:MULTISPECIES: DUF4258 domain-containing protein [Desulfobacula]|uniref:Conserved uncharacterized protein associated with anaerobic toluene degradation gene cluster n=2 Tax=Desulfobacula TaxID=28222 RepID=K0ND38_DESTT|nr:MULTISPECIES: DUF4258 domain-containing protein [Desulfobacula]CCK78670.1 conserved uncharacterized protein associated with anaerobic toluene degradation gene cluster [Desulfobacula toluolica Tol2]SDT88324.1 YgiT-type zinc finger domain-containing protein [Desulfobacula phenolica]
MSKKLTLIMDWIKSRTKDRIYFNSEHMVRYLTRRTFSISEIETVLAEGSILETHSHPLRNDCYLVLAYPDNKPIHVMCTKDKDENLIVLYAYRPSEPTWKDERTRRQVKGQPMDENLRKCFFCNSDIEPITVGNFDFRWEGSLYVIKGVPAGLCVQCGEKYISAEASKKIVAKIEKKDFTGKDDVLVFEYEG